MGLTLVILNDNTAQWVVAGATIFLALVALYGETYRTHRNRSIVKIGFGNDTPYTIDNYLTPYGRLFRIKVVNLGKTLAKNCQVKLLSVKSESGENVLDKDEPDILKWSDAPRDMNYRQDDWTWANKDPNKLPPIFREKKDITPKGGSELCDLFCVDSNKNIIFSSSGGRKFICEKEKRYFALIEIHGDNFKSTIKEIEIYTPFKIEKDVNSPIFIKMITVRQVLEIEEDLRKKFKVDLTEDLERFKKILVGFHPKHKIPGAVILRVGGGIYPVYKARQFRCRALNKGNRSGVRVIYTYNFPEEEFVIIEVYYKKKENTCEDKERVRKYSIPN